MDGDDEPLHVVITGDDQRSVDAATDMIQQMLVVIDDEKNVHKQQQLRELASTTTTPCRRPSATSKSCDGVSPTVGSSACAIALPCIA